MSTAKTLLTLEEFEAMPEPDGVKQELSDGELITMTLPRPRHNRVVKQAFLLLHEFLLGNPLGELFFPDTPFRLSAHTERGPDLAFVLTARVAAHDPDQPFEGAPDLAVEVVSPNDTIQGMRKKVEQYLKAGAKAVWVADPRTQDVDVYSGSPPVRKTLAGDDLLESPELLPGFSVPVRSLSDLT